MSSLPQWPRGPMNQLHTAAIRGSTERTKAVLARGVIDINQGDPDGVTALIFACLEGHPGVARILLQKGADWSIVPDDSFTALLASAHNGHVAVTKMILKAGADVQSVTVRGDTSLHVAACRGHSGVMEVLIEAGADFDSQRRSDGSTALVMAAYVGSVDAIKVLLRAGANPLLTSVSEGQVAVPLDAAAQRGHSNAVSELVRQLGIDGCGGATRGVRALMLAAQDQHVEVMATLASAGVVDTGWALAGAAGCGREVSVKLLLQQYKGTADEKRAYVNTRDNLDTTPVIYATSFASFSSVRVVRLLLDSGADASSRSRVRNYAGDIFYDTPLTLAKRLLREKKIFRGQDFTEDKLRSVEAVRRLLLRVEAVHAVSWLWVNNVPSVAHAAAGGTGRAAKAASTPLISMLPILRRMARRPRIVLAPLFRNSTKP